MSRPRKRPLPSVASICAAFLYDPHTGEIYRRPRQGRDNYNRRFCSAPSGHLQNHGYVTVDHAQQSLLAHRVAWVLHFGEWPQGEIDHRDNDKANNRIANLRLSTRSQNMHNICAKNGWKGVIFRAGCPNRPYRSQIRINGKIKYLGSYATPEAAAEAYATAARIHFEDFAYTPMGNVRATIIFSATVL